MAPHWPEEVDVFSEPHTRMKKLVHKYSKMVSATDFTDEYHMTSLLQNLIYVFCEFKAHEEIENILIMRNLKRKLKAACVTSAAVCNCHNDNRLTDMLEMVFDGSRSCWTEKSVKERQSYGHELQKALEDFTQNFLPHMEEEEEVFQPMLMQYFSYEELKELKAKVIHEHLVSSKQEKYVEDLYQKKAKTKQEPCYFDRLPDEICEKVFSYLNPQDLCRSAQTCHRWNTLTKDPSLWTGIYPVHWARGNWTFQPDPLGGVDGAGELNEELMEEFDPPVMCHDEDADVDESSSHDYDDDKDYYSDEDVSHRALAEYKMLSSLVKHLLPCVGSGVKVVDLAYSKGLNNSLVHKILKLCPNVEVLDLTRTQVGDDAFHEYGVSNRRSKLRHLDLTNCHNITDQTLCSLTGASVDGSIENGLDIEEGRTRISLGGQKESDIEISPTCCRKKQRVKKCEEISSDSALSAVENLNDIEAGTNRHSCGVSQIDSSVIKVYSKTCDEGDEISRTGNCDKRKDFVNNDSRVHDKNAKLISHPHKLSFETDEVEVHCDAIYRPMQSLPLVSDNNSFCKCEKLCQKSENLLDNLTCCRTNSRASVSSLQKNKNSVGRPCCKFTSCDDDNYIIDDDDDDAYDSQFDCTSSRKICCHHGSPETSNCAFKSAPNRTDCCHSSTLCDSPSPPSFTSSSSSSSSPRSSESSSDNEWDGSTSVDADQELFPYSHKKTAVRNCVRHHSEPLNLPDWMESEVNCCSFTPGNISSACCKSYGTGSATPCVKDVEIPSRAMNGLRITRPLSHLQFLSLNGCYRISDAGLRVLSIWGGTPHLEHLDLSGCVQVTGSSVEELVWTCGPQFDHANLFYCDNLPMDPFPTTASGCRNRGCSTRFCCSAD